MNHVMNDRGRSVIAVGAPGSKARLACEYPALIDRVNAAAKTSSRSDAVKMIQAAGISAAHEIYAALMLTVHRWHFERSSGFGGFRCEGCATWLPMGSELKCDCNESLGIPE